MEQLCLFYTESSARFPVTGNREGDGSPICQYGYLLAYNSKENSVASLNSTAELKCPELSVVPFCDFVRTEL